MKNTVQNSIFRNWIRKKWIFVRLQSYFFNLQPYMSEKVPWKPLRNVFLQKFMEHFVWSPAP